MKKSLGNYFKSHSLDSTTNNGSTTTTTTTTTTATTPTPTPSCNASLNSLHPDTLKLLYLTWLHGLFPEQSKATTLNHHHHPFSTSSSSSSSSTNTTTTASSSSSSSHFTSPSLPHHVLSALKNNELLCYEDVLHAEFNHAVYLSMHLPSYPNDKVSLISLLKQQHLSGQMNYEELYRCRLHLLKKQEKVYQTSGDVNAIHITDNLIYIASSAIATAMENREGNLLSIDPCTYESQVYEGMHCTYVQDQKYVQTISDMAIYQNSVLITCGYDQTVMVSQHHHLLHTYDQHHEDVVLLAQHPIDPQFVISAAVNGTLAFHDVSTLTSAAIQDSPKNSVSHLQFSPHQPHHLYVTTDYHPFTDPLPTLLRIYDTQQQTWMHQVPHLQWQNHLMLDIATFAMAPTVHLLALATYDSTDRATGDGMLHILDTRCLSEVMQLGTEHFDVNVVGFSPCSRFVYSCGVKNNVVVHDLRRPDVLCHWLHHDAPKIPTEDHDGICDATWLPRSNLLVTGGGDGCIRFWDVHRLSSQPADLDVIHPSSPPTFSTTTTTSSSFPPQETNPSHVFNDEWYQSAFSSSPFTFSLDAQVGPIAKFKFDENEQMLMVAGGSTVCIYKTG